MYKVCALNKRKAEYQNACRVRQALCELPNRTKTLEEQESASVDLADSY